MELLKVDAPADTACDPDETTAVVVVVVLLLLLLLLLGRHTPPITR